MSATDGTHINIQATLGAVQIGAYVAVALFGLMTMQSYHYYYNYPNDKLFLKFLVAWIWIMELVHSIFVTHACYEMSVIHFGDFNNIERVPFDIKLTIIWDTVIAFTVQTFFAYRLYIMSKRWELPIVCWTLTIVRTITSFYAVARFIEIKDQSKFFAEEKNVVTSVEVVSAVNDVIIAIGLCYYLSKNRSGIVGMDRLVSRLIRYTIQSGILTSIISVAMLITFLTMPDNWIWIAIHIVLAKPFSNSFLAMLNARRNLRSQFMRSETGTSNGVIVLERNASTREITTRPHSNRVVRTIEIEMTKMTESVTDDELFKRDSRSETNSTV